MTLVSMAHQPSMGAGLIMFIVHYLATPVSPAGSGCRRSGQARARVFARYKNRVPRMLLTGLFFSPFPTVHSSGLVARGLMVRPRPLVPAWTTRPGSFVGLAAAAKPRPRSPFEAGTLDLPSQRRCSCLSRRPTIDRLGRVGSVEKQASPQLGSLHLAVVRSRSPSPRSLRRCDHGGFALAWLSCVTTWANRRNASRQCGRLLPGCAAAGSPVSCFPISTLALLGSANRKP